MLIKADCLSITYTSFALQIHKDVYNNKISVEYIWAPNAREIHFHQNFFMCGKWLFKDSWKVILAVSNSKRHKKDTAVKYMTKWSCMYLTGGSCWLYWQLKIFAFDRWSITNQGKRMSTTIAICNMLILDVSNAVFLSYTRFSSVLYYNTFTEHRDWSTNTSTSEKRGFPCVH